MQTHPTPSRRKGPYHPIPTGIQTPGALIRRVVYADDTVIWSSDYHKICRAFTIITEFSASAGIPINAQKSDGISLLTRSGLPSELKNTKTSIDFLGYAISVDALSMKAASVKKIKRQISYLLYRNLIQPLLGSKLRGLIIPANDKDPALLTAISQIRRYMYGGLTSQQLRNYLSGRTRRIFFKGVISFYPLLNDEAQLRRLDGWLVSVVYRTIRRRKQLLKDWHLDRSHIFPFTVPQRELAQRFAQVEIGKKHLLELPSFTLLQKAIRRGLVNRGIGNVMNPQSNVYDY